MCASDKLVIVLLSDRAEMSVEKWSKVCSANTHTHTHTHCRCRGQLS